MTKLPLITLTLTLSACAGTDKSYRISDKFTDEESVAIRSQAQKWIHPELDRITFDDDADGLIELVDDCHGGECIASTEYHVARPGTVVQILNQRGRPDWLHVVAKNAAHEFGHVLAARLDNSHLSPGNVMAFSIDDEPDYPTAADFEFAKGGLR